MGLKPVLATRFQLFPKTLKIVDLPIKRDPKRIVLVRHGWGAAREVDDRKPLKSENGPVDLLISFLIRAPMMHGAGHCLQQRHRWGFVSRVDDSANAAHFNFPPGRRFSETEIPNSRFLDLASRGRF